ncbi:hypothetical protein CKO50_17110 [Pseudoalteromonas sp. HM-SA03]|uniref:hypothetical protein n=1 Tax=Pseudoalteromonas sp. HM-SA03 TaxID=2029678 RepID=UPI000BAE5C46|nr:hypothetical protein [Pseudoalteromonas sp. HM-SA03]PAY00144.1 hypothetical protein CKO50_17110 [Pseudoalteromonas sp. HM-SA03]
MSFDSNFDELAYPELVTISGVEFKAARNMRNGEVHIPYTEEPDVGIGDIIIQKSGRREIELKVLDVSFKKGGTLGVGTSHPNMLNMKVENASAASHTQSPSSSTFNIGSITGENFQVGNANTLSVNVTIKELTEKIASCDDEEAKSFLKKLLQNSTVGSLIGAGASSLLGLL